MSSVLSLKVNDVEKYEIETVLNSQVQLGKEWTLFKRIHTFAARRIRMLQLKVHFWVKLRYIRVWIGHQNKGTHLQWATPPNVKSGARNFLCEEFRQKFRSPQSPSATSNLGGSIICEKGYKMLSLCLEWAIGGPIAPCGIGEVWSILSRLWQRLAHLHAWAIPKTYKWLVENIESNVT